MNLCHSSRTPDELLKYKKLNIYAITQQQKSKSYTLKTSSDFYVILNMIQEKWFSIFFFIKACKVNFFNYDK